MWDGSSAAGRSLCSGLGVETHRGGLCVPLPHSRRSATKVILPRGETGFVALKGYSSDDEPVQPRG